MNGGYPMVLGIILMVIGVIVMTVGPFLGIESADVIADITNVSFGFIIGAIIGVLVIAGGLALLLFGGNIAFGP